ncbi:FAD-dependent monooxygenase [Ramlibacter sp. WS9]|uniref:FAD-dependent monooxygenase n=1 Tax=Ramlibacter sp. WS9 TaxID=1882741 RepID=UPI001144FF2F|nr:FAD-dependent monooxygenase [Ramlibacter sp. WS9]ROZ71212.1 FAD-dependent oxidoreductase [Ramlibacter sp. WS9]
MTRQVLIVGAGIGGLSAALAASRAGWLPRLYEQAPHLSEVGAGIQLGPNTTRILHSWGLDRALAQVAAFPQRLRVRSAHDGGELGTLALGDTLAQRYGAPYACVHRADMQALLLEAARMEGVVPVLASRVSAVVAFGDAVALRVKGGAEVEGDALIGADGLWSRVRELIWRDGPPPATGHVAYRSVASQEGLPPALRTQDVNVWLGPRMHLVAYPVRGGDALNVVVLVEGRSSGPADDWDQHAVTAELQRAMGESCAPLRDLVNAMPGWRLWSLHDRAPMRSADAMAQGCVALLGDAAHPMRPYFAQGAGMAIEDARELGRALSSVGGPIDVPLALRRYALNRWQRVARVQGLSRRNGRIFHAMGPVRWARDLAMRVMGERLLDQPWLYGE